MRLLFSLQRKRHITPNTQSCDDSLLHLVSRDTISVDVSASNRIPSLSAQIARVTLHGVDYPVFHSFDYPHMFCVAIPLPIKKDQVARRGLEISVLPLASVFKPLGTGLTACKSGNDPAVQIAAFVGAPGNKAGTPLHPVVEAVPRPIGVPAVSHLFQGHGYDLAVTIPYAVKYF